MKKVILFSTAFLLCMSAYSSNGKWYIGASFEKDFNKFSLNGSSFVTNNDFITNGGLNGEFGYINRLNNWLFITSFNFGMANENDKTFTQNGHDYYVQSTYHYSIRERIGYFVSPKIALYGMGGIGISSIGVREAINNELHYDNNKQLSALLGIGIQYDLTDSIATFLELSAFLPTYISAKPVIDLQSGGHPDVWQAMISLQIGLRWSLA